MKYLQRFGTRLRLVTMVGMIVTGMLMGGSLTSLAQPGQPIFGPPHDYGDYGVNSGIAATFATQFKAYWTYQSTGSYCSGHALVAALVNYHYCLTSFPIADQPTITFWNGTLYLAASDANTHQLIVDYSTDYGQNWVEHEIPGIYVAPGPAITAFNGVLYIAYQENASAHRLGIAQSTDGINFSNTFQSYRIGHSPGMTTHNNKLVIATFCQCDSHYLDVYTSFDGTNFSLSEDQSQRVANASPPSLVSYNGVLYISYIENGHRVLYTTTSYDGVYFSGGRNTGLSAYQGGGMWVDPFQSLLVIEYRGPDGTRDWSDATSLLVQ